MAVYEEALQIFSGFLTEEMEKMVMSKFSQLMTKVNKITDVDKTSIIDKDVEAAVSKVETSINTTFVHARSYVSKCNELASYVTEEEGLVIKLIEEGNSDEFKDYLEEVLDKSQGCQKDITTLIEFINVHDKGIISDQEKAIEKKQSQATKKAYIAGGVAALAGGATVAGIGAAILVPAVPVALGLGVAIVGLTIALKACDSIIDYQGIIQCCTDALEVINDLRTCLEEVETRLQRVNTLLKEAIDEKVQDIGDQKLDKLSQRKRPVIHSLIQTVKSMSSGCRRIQTFCLPLTKAETLNDFMSLL